MCSLLLFKIVTSIFSDLKSAKLLFGSLTTCYWDNCVGVYVCVCTRVCTYVYIFLSSHCLFISVYAIVGMYACLQNVIKGSWDMFTHYWKYFSSVNYCMFKKTLYWHLDWKSVEESGILYYEWLYSNSSRVFLWRIIFR